MSFEHVDEMDGLAEARAEGMALRNSVAVLGDSLKHLTAQFLIFSLVLFALLCMILGLFMVHSAFDSLREWIPGLCMILGFGACALFAQFLMVRQIQSGTRVVMESIELALRETML